MTVSDINVFKTINFLEEEHLNTALRESKCSWEDDRQESNENELRQATKDLQFVTGFGRGFWGGIKYVEYTLLYRPSIDTFFWVHDSGGDSDERLSVFKVSTDDAFFTKLNGLSHKNMFETFNEYFIQEFKNDYPVSLQALGFETMTNEELSLIWWDITEESLYGSPQKLVTLSQRVETERKANHAHAFVKENKDQLNTLIVEGETAFLVLQNGDKYPIVLGDN